MNNNNNEYIHLKYRLKSRLYGTDDYNLVTHRTDQGTALQVKQVPRGQGSEVRGGLSQRSEMNLPKRRRGKTQLREDRDGSIGTGQSESSVGEEAELQPLG